LDISPRSIEVARILAAKEGRSNVTFEEIDFTSEVKPGSKCPVEIGFQIYPFLKETFDVITSSMALETNIDRIDDGCPLADWLLESLSPHGKLVAVLTVNNWADLEQIITTWRSQGLRLNDVEMIYSKCKGEYSGHPALVLSREGEDLDINISEWAESKSEIIYHHRRRAHNLARLVRHPPETMEPEGHMMDEFCARLGFPFEVDFFDLRDPELADRFRGSDPEHPYLCVSRGDWRYQSDCEPSIYLTVNLDLRPPSIDKGPDWRFSVKVDPAYADEHVDAEVLKGAREIVWERFEAANYKGFEGILSEMSKRNARPLRKDGTSAGLTAFSFLPPKKVYAWQAEKEDYPPNEDGITSTDAHGLLISLARDVAELVGDDPSIWFNDENRQ
jgi:SAM-dependent methyltransferase